MTHLSDFSFLQRMVSFGYLYVWYTYRLCTLDGFKCLHPKRFKQRELKSIVTLLILFMIPFQLFYDITSVKIKYEEGFANILGRIFTKPEQMWTEADKALVIPTEYSLVTGFSLQTGTLVLLQCFWNFLANSVAKKEFMSSKEFMFYICWTFVSFIIFPILQYNFSRPIYDPTYKELIPEMVYGIELFIVGCLGVVSHFRFKRLLRNTPNTVNGRSISQKVIYFQEINVVLSTALLGHGSLLTVLSCDGLTPAKYLNVHKFTADFFICNINMCAIITWLCMILIFHPKHMNAVEAPTSKEHEMMTKESARITFNSGYMSDHTCAISPVTPYGAPNGSGNTYPHTNRVAFGDSITSENTYANQFSNVYGISPGSDENTFKPHHPLTKSGTIGSSSISPSTFQFGPLPIIPSSSQAPDAPSMNTLVSQSQIHGGRNNSSSTAKSDYLAMSNEKMLPSAEALYGNNYAAARQYQQQQLEKLGLTDSQTNHVQVLGKQEIDSDYDDEQNYAPPPLSPAKKGRVDILQSTRAAAADKDRRSYTQSMMIPCDGDMGEFGIKNKQVHTTISIIDNDVALAQKEEIPSPSNDNDDDDSNTFQQQHRSILTSFKELGFDSLALGTHETPRQDWNNSSSSVILPLQFESSSNLNKTY